MLRSQGATSTLDQKMMISRWKRIVGAIEWPHRPKTSNLQLVGIITPADNANVSGGSGNERAKDRLRIRTEGQ